MNTQRLFGCALFISLGLSAQAQVFSHNIVGYINQEFYAGKNLMANQLAAGDNTLNTIFQPGVPEGATFTEWDAATQQYLPASVYDTVTGWSINYELDYGQGGLFTTPSSFVNTFVGSVWPGFSGASPFVPPLVTGSGALLLSCVIPIGNATFYDVVGRSPQDGESVTILDGPSQISTTTTFDDGAWNNGAPLLAVGQAAFFNLENLDLNPGSVSVPEPTVNGLAAVGLLILAVYARPLRRSKSIS